MLFWCATALLIWAGIACLLWLGVKNTPIQTETGDNERAKFEIIPRSQEGAPDLEDDKSMTN